MNISEVMKLAPRYLTLRYGSLNSYVWESLYPQDYRNRIFSNIEEGASRDAKFQSMKSLADEASLLVFLLREEFFKRVLRLLKIQSIS